MVQNPHHAPGIRKPHTGMIGIENAGLIRILSCFPPTGLSEWRQGLGAARKAARSIDEYLKTGYSSFRFFAAHRSSSRNAG